MKTEFKLAYLTIVFLACANPSARAATIFDFNWADPDQNLGTGQLVADLAPSSFTAPYPGGQCYVVSGGTVSFTSNSGWLNGVWTVVPLSNPPQPENRYGLDHSNLLWPSESLPCIRFLMLERYFGEDSGEQIVIDTGNVGLQDYGIQGKMFRRSTDGVWYGTDGAGIFGGRATVEITPAPVPEPSTYVAGALLLFPFAAMTIRRFRKS